MQSIRPEKEFKVGAVRAAIWSNPRQTTDGRPFNSRKVILERTYKDGPGFKSTGSLEINDVPKAILALKKAYDWMMCADRENDKAAVGREQTISLQERSP